MRTREKLSNDGLNVHGFGFADWISPGGFTADSSIQYSGKATTPAITTVTTSAISRPGRRTVRAMPRSGAATGRTAR